VGCNRVAEFADDDANAVDAECSGVGGAGHVYGSENAALPKEAKKLRTERTVPHNVAGSVDSPGVGGRAAGNVDFLEGISEVCGLGGASNNSQDGESEADWTSCDGGFVIHKFPFEFLSSCCRPCAAFASIRARTSNVRSGKTG